MNAVPQTFHDQWLTTAEAAEEIGLQLHYLYTRSAAMREACEHRSNGTNAGADEMRGRGIVYLAYDIQRLARVVKAGFTLETACKLIVALDRGLIP